MSQVMGEVQIEIITAVRSKSVLVFDSRHLAPAALFTKRRLQDYGRGCRAF